MVTYTGSVLLSGTLLDNSGNPLANMTVALSYAPSSGGTPTPLTSVTTNASGAFSETVVVPAGGPYVFTATFSAVTTGTPNYDGATQTATLTTVPIKTVMTLTAAAQ